MHVAENAVRVSRRIRKNSLIAKFRKYVRMFAKYTQDSVVLGITNADELEHPKTSLNDINLFAIIAEE